MAKDTKPATDANQTDQTTASTAAPSESLVPLFTAQHLPATGFKEYTKRFTTRAIRIEGAFAVETSEGRLSCENGYLALDVNGNPYPIDANVFDQTYEPQPQTNDVGTPTLVSDPEIEDSHSSWLADQFSYALLKNPNVERFTYGNPFERRHAGDHQSVGAFLYHACYQLAKDYQEARKAHDIQIAEQRMREKVAAAALGTQTQTDAPTA